MAIAPGQYPFTGGAVMGGGGPVTFDDLKSLILKKGGSVIGSYNPGLPQPTEIDIPDETIGFHHDGSFSPKTSVANTPLKLLTIELPSDGVYLVSLMLHVKPTVLAGTTSEMSFSMLGPDSTGLSAISKLNCIDDSDDYYQSVDFNAVIPLTGGTNILSCTMPGAYLVSVDRYSVTSLS